jgi:hypothetical protein
MEITTIAAAAVFGIVAQKCKGRQKCEMSFVVRQLLIVGLSDAM